MIDPKISIGIPTCNQSDFILQCVNSALNIEYKNLEVIVSDDSSDEKTNTILKPYIEQKKIKYYRNKPALGRVQNYQKILYEYSTSEWHMNLDGDDYYIHKDFLNEALKYLLDTPDLMFIQFNHTKNIVDAPTVNPKIMEFSATEYLSYFCRTHYFSHLGLLYNRKLAIANNFYSYNILSTDIKSVLKLVLTTKGKTIVTSEIIGLWRQHDKNTSNKSSDGLIVKNYLSFLTLLCENFSIRNLYNIGFRFVLYTLFYHFILKRIKIK